MRLGKAMTLQINIETHIGYVVVVVRGENLLGWILRKAGVSRRFHTRLKSPEMGATVSGSLIRSFQSKS